jgi:cell wall-associated NlpC family hydrolase
VFFTKTYNTPRTVTHAGIYLGNGKFIHASSSKGVIISDIYDPYYWGDKYIFGTRLTN